MPDPEKLEAPLNFRWLHEGRIAGAGKPSRPSHCAWIKGSGINAVLSVDDVPDAVCEFFDRNGIEHRKILYEDEPSPEQLDEILSQVARWLGQKKSILIHCSAGISRTGFLLHCLGQDDTIKSLLADE